MTENQEEKRPIPPYLPFKTFENFVERLKISIPSRIDRSLMTSFSGATQAQLLSTLKYLNLISANGVPTESLHPLVHSEGVRREKVLEEILTASYPFLFGNKIDLKRTTSSHLVEVFSAEGGITGGTVRKCIAFFVAMAKAAGIELSPHIMVKGAIQRSAPRRSNTERTSRHRVDIPVEQESAPPQKCTESWEQLMLSKFPGFDPAWPDEVKTKWFEGFEKLMEHLKKKEKKAKGPT